MTWPSMALAVYQTASKINTRNDVCRRLYATKQLYIRVLCGRVWPSRHVRLWTCVGNIHRDCGKTQWRRGANVAYMRSLATLHYMSQDIFTDRDQHLTDRSTLHSARSKHFTFWRWQDRQKNGEYNRRRNQVAAGTHGMSKMFSDVDGADNEDTRTATNHQQPATASDMTWSPDS